MARIMARGRTGSQFAGSAAQRAALVLPADLEAVDARHREIEEVGVGAERADLEEPSKSLAAVSTCAFG
jgi:hypothetical protein